jgi:hypothetical protein
MKQMMVRYKVKADRAQENERFVKAVFEELRRVKPPGLRYTSLRLDDGVSFVHIVSAPDHGDPLPELSAFKAFIAEIRDRCEEAPTSARWETVGAYGMFGE